MKRTSTWIFIGLAVVVFYLWRYKRAPDLELASIQVVDATGTTRALQTTLADSSIVIFYASWCGPCLKELRELKHVFSDFEREGVRFFCVTDDTPEKIDVMRANMPNSFHFLHTPSLKGAGIYTIPATYIIRNGKITDKQLNALDWSRRKEILEAFNNN